VNALTLLLPAFLLVFGILLLSTYPLLAVVGAGVGACVCVRWVA
jgi:hypothetical protein